MGASMNVGLCTKVSFSKSDTDKIKKHYPNVSDFQMAFEKETQLALSYYNVTESEGAYIFTVKPELLEPNDLLLFLKDFFSFSCNNEERYLEDCAEMFEKISQFNSAAEIMACIENVDDFIFRLYDARDEVHLSSGLYLPFKFNYVSLDTYHKAYIELEGALFSYLARLIQFKHPQPQAKLIKFFIDDY
jgi:hypothetical protein